MPCVVRRELRPAEHDVVGVVDIAVQLQQPRASVGAPLVGQHREPARGIGRAHGALVEIVVVGGGRLLRTQRGEQQVGEPGLGGVLHLVDDGLGEFQVAPLQQLGLVEQ